MIYIRPVKKSDLNSLTKLASQTEAGLTTLPNDKNFLSKKIDASLRAFDDKVHTPRGEDYLFVLTDSSSDEIMGTSGICSKVGGFQPFYTYKLKTELYKDPDLKIKKNIKTLHLTENHDGPSEICSLFIGPAYRSKGLGRLLSLSRFLFMAEFPQRFDGKVISELRGVSDEKGISPFWNCVGKHFFEIEFAQADFLSGLGHKTFIKNLMPQHPIYIAMLPISVQKVIGKVHEFTKPALHLLEKEGFVYKKEVDIFDAGPTVSAPLQQIKTVKKSRTAVISRITKDKLESKDYLISNTKLDFRACVGQVAINKNSVCIGKKVAQVLNVKESDNLRFA